MAPRITNVGSSMMTRLRIVPLALGLALASQLGYIPLVLVVVSASLIPLGVGVPAVIGSVAMCRWFADLHRGVAGSLLGREVPRPYRPIRRDDTWLTRFRVAGGDPATWRDLCWLLANTVVGLVTNLLVVALLLSGLFYVTCRCGGRRCRPAPTSATSVCSGCAPRATRCGWSCSASGCGSSGCGSRPG